MYSENNEEREAQKIESTLKQNLKCAFCSKVLSSRQNLKEHLFIHSGERPYKCTEPGCSKTFRQGSLLSIHRRIHKEIAQNLELQGFKRRKPSFPKLTEMLKSADSFDLVLEKNEIDSVKEKMTESEFCFLEHHLKLKNKPSTLISKFTINSL